MNNLFWFRSDLRITDNHALVQAIANAKTMTAVYIATPKTWQSHDLGDCKINFILNNLTER